MEREPSRVSVLGKIRPGFKSLHTWLPHLQAQVCFSSPIGMFTECIILAFTKIWGQFAANSIKGNNLLRKILKCVLNIRMCVIPSLIYYDVSNSSTDNNIKIPPPPLPKKKNPSIVMYDLKPY